MVEIQLERDEAYNCVANILKEIAGYWGRHHEMIFLDAWNFGYKDKNGAPDTVGKKLSLTPDAAAACFQSICELLDRYHGIKAYSNDNANDFQLSFHPEMLTDNPVIVEMDAFGCPWRSEEYQKLHQTIHCLSVGYQNERVFCLDEQYSGVQAIELNELVSHLKKYVTFALTHAEVVAFDWNLLLRQSVGQLIRQADGRTVFDEMITLANEIVTLDFVKEFDHFEQNPANSELMVNIYSVARGRKQFAQLLGYIRGLFGVAGLEEFQKRLQNIGNQWCVIFSMIIKAYYHDDRFRILNKVREKVIDIAAEESAAACQLLGFLHQCQFRGLQGRNERTEDRRGIGLEPAVNAENPVFDGPNPVIPPPNGIQRTLEEMWNNILQTDRAIGSDSNFFELGGNSLKITHLALQIEKTFGIKIRLSQMFSLATLNEQAEYLMSAEKSAHSLVEPVKEQACYPLSAAQKRLYILSQLGEEQTNYNIPGVAVITGKLDPTRLEAAFKGLIRRHEALRTSFELADEEPVQRIHGEVDFQIRRIQAEETEAPALIKDFVRPFDLSRPPLVRVGLIELSKQKHILVTDLHHIIADGLSMGIIRRELMRLYQGEKLPDLRIQYKDFSAWQNRLLKSELLKPQEEYWLERYRGELPVLNLPADYPRPAIQSFAGDRIAFKIGAELTRRLNRLAAESHSTMFMVLLAAFNVLLSKYTGQEDIIVGTPVAGRSHSDLENVVGMFVNTLALRNYPEGRKTFAEFLAEVRADALKAYDHQEYPFDELVEQLGVDRDVSRNPLFDVMFAMENREPDRAEPDELPWMPYPWEHKTAKFDLTLAATETDREIRLSWEYCTRLFKKETVERLTKHFLKLLEQITADAQVKLAEIDMLTESEKQRILVEFNNTRVEYAQDQTIHGLFEEQAAKSPEHIALVHEDRQMTYAELNRKANRLANILRAKGVGANRIVGIMAEPSVEMIIGILGILKAGGAYLPIDPEYPEERIRFMLGDSGARILLTQRRFKAGYGTHWEVVELDDPENYQGIARNPEIIYQPDDLAYLIYTSGSTGRPKGVPVEQKSLVNLALWHNRQYQVTPSDRGTKYAGFGFDASVWEIFPYLIAGASIHIIEKSIRLDAARLNEYYEQNKITVSFLPTQICEQFLDLENHSLRALLTGGDVLRKYKAKNYALFNHYGPTENTVVTSCMPVNQNYANIPIGKPIANVRTYIVDQYHRMQPVGIPGELCVSGAGLARGYLNLPELTAAKFVTNPLEPGERMYRTGDLARWLPDGDIEFLGRIDQQVKIRGFRIEPGEIESQLLKHTAIQAAVVVARDDPQRGKYLCAYIVAAQELTVAEFRRHLSRELPDYMIPSYLVQLEQLPLTPNGKIDRKALPEPGADIQTGVAYQAPRNETELELAKIWQEVLGVARAGIDDNFFELGGHSLKAIALMAKLHQIFNKAISLKAIFSHPTIKALAGVIEKEKANPYAAIPVAEAREYYPLSAAQKRLYILSQLGEGQTNYNIPGVAAVAGELDPTRLEAAFKGLIQRHEALRTSFELVEGEPVQKVHGEVDFQISRFRAEESEAPELINGFIRPFDLSRPPLLRVGLISLSNQKHLLMVDVHHIIADGVSMEIVNRELMSLYQGEKLPDLRIQYKDFSAWQNRLLQSEHLKRQEEYWLERYQGELPVLNLPTDYPRPAMQSFAGDRINLKIGAGLTRRLDRLAAESNSTMFMVLLAAFNVLLSKYSGQEDIIVGTPIAGRSHSDLEKVVGMFVNTLALRNYPEGHKTFTEFLAEVKDHAIKAYDHQEYQFEVLVEQLRVNRDVSRNPLFDVMFVMQNMGPDRIEPDALQFTPYPWANKTSVFDLTLAATETDREIRLNLEYCARLFKKETVAGLAKHFLKILEQITAAAQVKLAEIDIVTESEKKRLLIDFNDTRAEYPKDKTVHQLFEEQAARTPGNVAVVCEDRRLTYGELNAKANQLAGLLRGKGIKRETVVAIMAERAPEMITGILAILKSGAAYLPIDPDYPEERIRFMLEDSHAALLLTQGHLKGKYPFDREVIDLDDEAAYLMGRNNPGRMNQPRDLAYLIYTSGTTGRPKGVMVEHGNVIAYQHAFRSEFEINEATVVLQQAICAFDIFVEEVFPVLLSGGKLVILKGSAGLDLVQFGATVKKNAVNIISCPPSLLNELNDPAGLKAFDSVRLFISGGDLLKPDYYSNLIKQSLVYNTYGPTEATVCATYYRCKEGSAGLSRIPIGKPIPNYRVYILDPYNRLLPAGVPGELCISGDGVARGYLNQPQLSAEKFIVNPFDPKERMYRTGDLARWLPDGNIEFLGRIDQQVKIRGFRIEPGEIETQLLKHAAIQAAVVVAQDDPQRGKYLCAYIVATQELTVAEFRRHLSRELPDYMIPSYLVQLEQLPLTPNGKIDRKALPAPGADIQTGVAYQAPRNETELKLAKIWQEVLGVARAGIDDNFFELGGHSLKAIALMAKLHQIFNKAISLKAIFSHPTIKALAGVIEKEKANPYAAIPVAKAQACYRVSAAQKRLYILNQLEEGRTNYNIPGVAAVAGELDPTRLEAAFKGLIQRHEALRTSFELVEGEPVQKVHGEVDFQISRFRAEESKAPELINGFIRPFDLSRAPLLRVGLIELSNQKNLLVVDVHHIVADGISMEIINRELISLYQGEELPDLRIQYKDFSAWQNRLLQSEHLKRQEEYWLERYLGELPVLNLPTDYPRPAIQSFAGDRINVKIGAGLTRRLDRLAAESNSTMFMVLLAAFNVLLSRYSGQEEIIVGTPIAGRSHSNLEKVVGMFVNTVALRNFPEGNKSFAAFLAEVRDHALKAYDNQDYPFDELVEQLDLTRDVSRNPLFDVMFAMQNMDRDRIEPDQSQWTPYPWENKTSKFDLALAAAATDREIRLSWEYCTRLFKKETVERLSKHFLKLLEEITADAQVKLAEIDMLTESEKQRILVDFNNTRAEYGRAQILHALFEEQAAGSPENIALVHEDRQMTYAELNRKANRLASALRAKGVGANRIVGIMAERSMELITGILGILKAGGAYLPIDPEYPEERIGYLLRDSGARILLTQSHWRSKADFDGEIVVLDDEEFDRGPEFNLPGVNRPTDLAYVIYTSGSTGKPKGVMISHGAAANTILDINCKFKIGAADRLIGISSVCFDLSVYDILGALSTGAALVVIRDPRRMKLLLSALEAQRVTFWNSVPAVMELFIDTLEDDYRNTALKWVLLSGDWIPLALPDKIRKHFPAAAVIGLGGATEGAIWSIYYPIGAVKPEWKSIPYGAPLANQQIYVLDQGRNCCPIGVPGELYIGGRGVAQGYLNDPEKTQRAFIHHPELGYLYKTGDRAVLSGEGYIEFLGRIDHQVKIRGFRVEPGEIEKQLVKHEAIQEAVVVAKDDPQGGKYLCAYIVAKQELAAAGFRKHLSQELPDYMIPSYFVQLEQLPLTPNGKIDRKALPEPGADIRTGAAYEAPRNETETKLAAIWQEVLGTARVGITDNLFELGGHSLKTVRLSDAIHKEFHVEVSLVELYRKPTVKEIARLIQNSNSHSGFRDNHLTCLKKSPNPENNLFFVHDGSGEVNGYLELVDRLSHDCNYWGIKAGIFDQLNPESVKIELLAEQYIESIKKVQASGPYNLAGWSNGGTIAFEIARQLERAKERVGCLIMIDSMPPDRSCRQPANIMNIDAEIALIKSKVLKAENTDDASKLFHIKRIRTIAQACLDYVPGCRINTRICYIKASESRNIPEQKWNQFCNVPVHTIMMQGDHFSIFETPKVDGLARRFGELFDSFSSCLSSAACPGRPGGPLSGSQE
jgi:tyrocidine synthetase-3